MFVWAVVRRRSDANRDEHLLLASVGMPFFGILHLLSGESGFLSLLYAGFTLWMLIECVRKDPDRYLWLCIILFVPGVGPIIYFFVRWLPQRNLQRRAGLAG